MAEIITTRGISYHLEQLIIESRISIDIVTPYLKIANSLYQRLADANSRGIEINIVYGKTELKKDQKDKLWHLDNCRILFVENLHAKVFLNEQKGIIGSMNLYDFSEVNNVELGIVFTKKKDYDLLHQAQNEVDLIKCSALVRKQLSSEEGNIAEKKLIKSILEGEKDFRLENYPVEGINISKKYGFATYHFDKDDFDFDLIHQEVYQQLERDIGRHYRIYWSEANCKISFYKNNGITFKSEQEIEEYKQTAILEANGLIRILFSDD